MAMANTNARPAESRPMRISNMVEENQVLVQLPHISHVRDQQPPPLISMP